MADSAPLRIANLAVVLLLGGRSSRMGSAKHLLEHPATRRPLYQHHLDLLVELEKQGVFPAGVVVSARADQRDQLELPEGVELVVDDPDKNGAIGPASGILEAANAKPDATWLVLAVDLPFVTRSSILRLVASHARDSPVSLYLHPSDGNPEPLFSVWTPRALEQLRANCREGKSGPCRAAKDVWGGKVVEGRGGVSVVEDDCVRDADTPEEWEQAVAELAKRQQLRPGATSSQPSAPAPPPFAPAPTHSISFHTALALIDDLPLPQVVGASSIPDPAFSTSNDERASRLPLVEAAGGISSATVRATLPCPLHDNSAMDGYAVPSSLLATASPDRPVLLPILGRIVAGDPPPPPELVAALGTHGCWEVMTGAVLPSAAFDAVVKVEDAHEVGEADRAGRRVVRFVTRATPQQHRRARGEQVQPGDVVLGEGERVSPEKVLLLAACGIAQVAVRSAPLSPPRRPRGRVGIVATGKEIVPLASLGPGREPAPGHVVDCITPFLSALLHSHGFEPVVLSSSGDSRSAFASTVAAALVADPPFSLLVTVAGVSRGSTDHIPSSLASLGISPVFHGVKIRPGAPVKLGFHPPTPTRASCALPVLSLPGNPMASAACMRSFGGALLERLSGAGTAWRSMDAAQARRWAQVLPATRSGSSSFWTVPLDAQSGLPSLESAMARRWTWPGALGSLAGAGAWVRVDVDEQGASVAWRSF
ncbi:hypothetical protein JCM3775_003873 [Rhodotorula graminis]